jgi:hypothetical protein
LTGISAASSAVGVSSPPPPALLLGRDEPRIANAQSSQRQLKVKEE